MFKLEFNYSEGLHSSTLWLSFQFQGLFKQIEHLILRLAHEIFTILILKFVRSTHSIQIAVKFATTQSLQIYG